MSAPYIIPFNFQPVNVVSASSGTYTVPSGKYAKVTVVLSSMMAYSGFAGTTTDISQTLANTSESGHVAIDFYLKAGDVLSFSSTSGSGVTVNPGGTTTASFSVSTTSSQIALINSNTAAVARAYYCGYFDVIGTASTFMGISVGTSNNFSYIAQEYNVIS